jgi:large subunit ribosomal protein L30
MQEHNKLKITLIRSLAGKTESQRRTIKSLGLKKLGSTSILPNVNPIRGQVNKIIQFVKVEEI